MWPPNHPSGKRSYFDGRNRPSAGDQAQNNDGPNRGFRCPVGTRFAGHMNAMPMNSIFGTGHDVAAPNNLDAEPPQPSPQQILQQSPPQQYLLPQPRQQPQMQGSAQGRSAGYQSEVYPVGTNPMPPETRDPGIYANGGYSTGMNPQLSPTSSIRVPLTQNLPDRKQHNWQQQPQQPPLPHSNTATNPQHGAVPNNFFSDRGTLGHHGHVPNNLYSDTSTHCQPQQQQCQQQQDLQLVQQRGVSSHYQHMRHSHDPVMNSPLSGTPGYLPSDSPTHQQQLSQLQQQCSDNNDNRKMPAQCMNSHQELITPSQVLDAFAKNPQQNCDIYSRQSLPTNHCNAPPATVDRDCEDDYSEVARLLDTADPDDYKINDCVNQEARGTPFVTAAGNKRRLLPTVMHPRIPPDFHRFVLKSLSQALEEVYQLGYDGGESARRRSGEAAVNGVRPHSFSTESADGWQQSFSTESFGRAAADDDRFDGPLEKIHKHASNGRKYITPEPSDIRVGRGPSGEEGDVVFRQEVDSQVMKSKNQNHGKVDKKAIRPITASILAWCRTNNYRFIKQEDLWYLEEDDGAVTTKIGQCVRYVANEKKKQEMDKSSTSLPM